MLVVTQPDVVSLRGVKRLLDLWKRLQVREDDEDVLVVLNRASRKLEVQPDLARKVIAGQARRDDDPRRLLRLRGGREYGYTGAYGGREAARELRQPARRGRRAARRRARSPSTDPSEPRGLLARLGGERGQGSAEMMGLLPVLALVVLALWQVGLLGYTYLLAGHAAREGARELAVNTVDTKKDKPYRDAAEEDLPKAWRKDAKIEIDKDDPVTVNVRLNVPIVLPGLEQPVRGLRPRLDVGRGRAAAAVADRGRRRTSHEGAARRRVAARRPRS